MPNLLKNKSREHARMEVGTFFLSKIKAYQKSKYTGSTVVIIMTLSIMTFSITKISIKRIRDF
jgi:hypothetical protein